MISRKITTAVAGVALAAAAAAGCASSGHHGGSSGGNSAYNGGFAFGQATLNVSTAQAAVWQQSELGDTNETCSQLVQAGPTGIKQMTPAGESVPASEMPPAYDPGATAWIKGCTAGASS